LPPLVLFLRNLAGLVIIGVVLLVLFPVWMSEVYKLYGAIFGPLALLILVVAALPARKHKNTKEK